MTALYVVLRAAVLALAVPVVVTHDPVPVRPA